MRRICFSSLRKWFTYEICPGRRIPGVLLQMIAVSTWEQKECCPACSKSCCAHYRIHIYTWNGQLRSIKGFWKVTSATREHVCHMRRYIKKSTFSSRDMGSDIWQDSHFPSYVRHHTISMENKSILNGFTKFSRERTGGNRILQNHHWLNASDILPYITWGPFTGVMNIWRNVAALLCHNLMVTMEFQWHSPS